MRLPDNSSFAELPNELVLRIFGQFSLGEFITARSVCHRWRTLVPFIEMGETRKAMLDFFDDLLLSPWFLKTRAWVRANLKPFDRQAYISKLLRQYPSLPETFRTWVLEWPERAVIAGLWPGLPRKNYFVPFTDKMNVMEGVNWLSYPQVSLMTYLDLSNRIAEHIPGILVWKSQASSIWVIVDEREDLNGKIFSSGLCRSDVEGSLNVDKVRHAYDSLDTNWITFQRKIWESVEEEAEHRVKMGLSIWPDDLEGIPINSSPSAFPDISDFKETAWVRRNEPQCQQRLQFLNESHFN